jgi:hypothetical protein
LGNANDGAAAHVLRVFYAAGIEPDRRGKAIREASYHDVYEVYPVVFQDPTRGAKTSFD